MNFTKYIGMYQSFIKDSHIHLKQNTISTLKSVPHFYKTFTYENRDGVSNKCFHYVRIGGQYRISKKSFDNWLDGKEGETEDGIC